MTSPDNIDPHELQRLKKEYLKAEGINPDFSYSPDKKNLLITYRSDRDLTLPQLNDFLTHIANKFQTVFEDLCQPSGSAAITRKFISRKLAEASEETTEAEIEKEDHYEINRIVTQGYRERGFILDILDRMIDHIKSFDVLIDLSKGWEDLSHYFEDAFHDSKWLWRRRWVEDEEITQTLAEKLDEFLDEIKRNFELKLKPD